MIYFTSDWHLGEERIGINGKPNLFYRPFSSIREQNDCIMNNFYSVFKDGDILWHLGDVISGNIENAERRLQEMKIEYPNSTFNLILGNYDIDKQEILHKYFDNIYEEYNYFGFDKNINVYLNHSPINCKNKFCPADPYNGVFSFTITGHIHGLWKVQHKMINVGVDVWHFRPVSMDEILFCWSAMKNNYDSNVFPY